MDTRMPGIVDLVRAPRLGWSIRKMQTAVVGLFSAWSVYALFTYIALLADSTRSEGIFILFRTYEFFPFLPLSTAGIIAPAIYAVGIVASLCFILLTATTVSVIAVEDLKGNLLFQNEEAHRYVKAHISTVLLPMVILAALVLLFAAGCAVAALVARIPVVGEIVLALCALPLFFWGLAGAATALVLLFGFITVPAIVAWEGEDVLETVLEAFSIVWSRPVRFFLLQIAARLLTLFSVLLLGLLGVVGVLLLAGVFFPVAGFKCNELFTIALYRIPGLMNSEHAIGLLYSLSVIFKTPLFVDTTAVAPSVRIAGWVLGGSFLLGLLWIASYGFCVFFSAQAVICRILRPERGTGAPAAAPSCGKEVKVLDKVESSNDTAFEV
jgi:hypothetical protein